MIFRMVAWEHQALNKRAMQRALNYLAYRSRSESEMRSRLLERFPVHTVETIVMRLSASHLLDDKAFAYSWTRSRLTNKPRSISLITRELMAKGIDHRIIQDVLSETDDEVNAYRAGQKVIGRLPKSDYKAFMRKGWQFLQRRGFSTRVIRRTLDYLWYESKGSIPG